MTKREAKIEALRIAFALITRVDHSMYEDDDWPASFIDREKIFKELYDIGWKLNSRAKKLEIIKKGERINEERANKKRKVYHHA